MISLSILTILLAQQTAPMAPPIKSGSFSCYAFTQDGRKITLSGELGNWREERGVPLADIQISAPGEAGLSFRTSLAMRPGVVTFLSYDQASKVSVSGTLDVGYGKDGMITLDRKVHDESGSRTRYAGFCDTRFTSAPQRLV